MKERNQLVDALRGLAMLLVVLGHTISGSAAHGETAFVNSVVLSLQIPLFILISGYVTRFGRPAADGAGLWRLVKKRTAAYLLPWLVWTVLVRGLLCREQGFLDPRYLLWHMDAGYWFLATVWTVNIVFALASFCAHRLCAQLGGKRELVQAGAYVLGMAALAALGRLAGMGFFAIRLTLYYMPFYYLGYLIGRYGARLRLRRPVRAALTAAALVLWLCVLVRFPPAALGDAPVQILRRVASSLLGCAAVCGIAAAVCRPGRVTGAFAWVGVHSLEIYLCHYLLLTPVRPDVLPAAASWPGAGLIALNFALTDSLTAAAVWALNRSGLLRAALFGKLPQRG